MANRRRIIFGLAASAIALLGLVLPFSDTNQPVVPTPTEVNSTESQALQIYRDLPLLFIANKGQMDSHAEFYVKSSNHTLYLTRDSIIFDLFRPSQSREHNSGFPLVSGEIPPSTSEHLQFSLNFIGANNDMRVKGNDPAKAIVNHFVGNDPDRWRTNIPTYREILYEGIYPNIDLRLYGKQGSINYDFIVHPGGNVADIKLAYAGVSNTRLHEAGMTAETLFGDIEQSQPFIYQQTGDAQVEVAGSFGLLDANTYGFQVATYDVSLPLVIDPSLVYSTYLGGSLKDGGTGIAADSSGCAYIVGATSSTDFPLRNAYQGTLGDGNWGDAFVTKIDTTKTGNDSLIYSTYLGGNDQDFGLDIAVDTNGCAYVTGYTSSTNFPTTPNAFQSVHRGTYDAFVAKLSASGSALEYSTYLGGNGRDEAHGIAIDSTGNAYVSGVTSSTNFPTTPNAFQSAHGGTSDAFVAKLSANGSALEYSTYLGGSGNDPSADIAVDSTGCAYVVGLTSSTNFPVQNPIQVYRGNIDIFVTKFSASGSAVIYSTYLGGGGYDGFAGGALLMFGGIAVDPQGCAYITGFTVSADFPTTPNAYQPTIAGSRDVFVSKLNAPGTALDYSTYLGGSDEEYGCDIAVDSDSCAYVVGITVSTDFPTMNPLQTCNHAYGKTNNAFVSKIDMGKTGADGLMFSTYLNDDFGCVGTAIAVDQMDSAYVTGVPAGNNFPIKNAYQPFRVLDWDAFVAKIETATLNRPPNIPSNPSPANYAAPVLPGVTLSWDGGDPDAGDTMTYDVYLGRCLGMQWAKVSANQTGTTFDTNSIVIPWLLPLWPNTRYYWRIVARDNSGAEAYGPNWTFFTTSISPSAVTGDVINLEPEGTSENVTFRATLTGNLTSLGTFASADVWFQLSYQPLPGKRDISIPTPTMRMDAEGAFSIDVTGLPPGQKFSFRSMAAPANPAVPPAQDWCNARMGDGKWFNTGLSTSTGTGVARMLSGNGFVSEALPVDETTLPTTGKPNVVFTHGLFSFTITEIPVGSTVTVNLTLPSPMPSNTQYWKYSEAEGWVNVTSLLGSNDGDNVLTLTLTDGGAGDTDGIANGIIVDPGGPGIPIAPTPTPEPAPTPGIGNVVKRSEGASTGSLPAHGTPPNLKPRQVSISSGVARVNQPVTVTTEIVNEGGTAGNTKVALVINGFTEQVQTLRLEPGAARTVTFTVQKDKPGKYEISVGDQRASFLVVREEAEVSPVNNSLLPILLMGGLFLAVIVVLVAAFRRRTMY